MSSLWHRFLISYRRFAFAPKRVLVSTFGLTALLAVALILTGMRLYQPTSFALGGGAAGGPVVKPSDFTPLASAPAEFGALPTATISPVLAAEGNAPTTPPAATATSAMADATQSAAEALLESNAARSRLGSEEGRYLAILLLGADSRPDDEELARSDTLIVAVLDMVDPHATVISIPRDLWVPIPGYYQARVNTAYFLGEIYETSGAELARQTVSQLLNIPISHTVTIDFTGFRRLIDEMGGITIDVPETIDDWSYPDDNYGTIHLHIDAGVQAMDGDLALKYARTRHMDSDIYRAGRQQAVIRAVRQKLLEPSQIPLWPQYIRIGFDEIDTSLSLPDLFYLARYARALDDRDIEMHVIGPPLLWEGYSGNGQQVLIYNPVSLEAQVREWLAPQPASPNVPETQ